MKNKIYAVDYKVKAVEMYKKSGRTKSAVSKELGIAVSSLCKWEIQYEAGVFCHQDGQSGSKVQSSSDKEIIRLTSELKRRTMEVEILKKATAFFAKESL